MSTIVLERFAYAPDGTFGKFLLPKGKSFFSVELPWFDNKPFTSCIPEGSYELVKRRSQVVKRSSGGEYDEGWEVTDVIGRDDIMIHPGNWPFNFQGCIGIGLNYEILNDRAGVPRNAVTQSRQAFKQFMSILDEENSWVLKVKQREIVFP